MSNYVIQQQKTGFMEKKQFADNTKGSSKIRYIQKVVKSKI